MLSRCPRPFLHRTASKGDQLHTQNHEIVHLPSSEDEKPVLQPPHQIVIGFDLGAESIRSLHTQAACGSPRSVLETHHLCFRAHHQQSRSPRSPLSALGSLLSGHPRNGPCAEGAALCRKVTVKSEDVAVGANGYHAFSRRRHVACDVDGANAYHSLLKREYMACDADRSNADIKRKPISFSRTDHVGVTQNQPCNHGPSERACCGGRANPHCKTFLSRDYEDEDSDDDDDADGEDVDNRSSIFSTASPVPGYSRHDSPEVDFLSECFLCRRHLLQEKDIYMYRGDRAFCSQECRHQQIVIDERKERYPAARACISGASTHHERVRRATQASVA